MKFRRLLCTLLLLIIFGQCATGEVLVDWDEGIALTEELMVEYGEYYYTPEEVALYLYVFEELPVNFMTKQEARDAGWSSGKDLWKYAPGCCIGGDIFRNFERILPVLYDDHFYTECDVNYEGGHRGGERIVFSDEGHIYYSEDHYDNFLLMYDGWYCEEELTA